MRDRGDAEPFSNRNVIEGNRISGSGRPTTNPPAMPAVARKAIMVKKDRTLASQATLTSDSQETQAASSPTRESPQAYEDPIKLLCD